MTPTKGRRTTPGHEPHAVHRSARSAARRAASFAVWTAVLALAASGAVLPGDAQRRVFAADMAPATPLAAATAASSAPPLSPLTGALTAASSLDIADAERGLAVFSAHCASCHGPTGNGDGPLVDRLPSAPPNLADVSRMNARSPADLYGTVTDGRLEAGMPPFGRLLSDAERWDVVAAVRSLSELHPLRIAVGRATWQSTCTACHGDASTFAASITGTGGGTVLADQSPDALAARFDAVGAHDALTTSLRAREAALAWLHAAGTHPLEPPGLSAGGAIEGVVVGGGAVGTTGAPGGLTMTLRATTSGLDLDWGTATVDPDGRFRALDLAIGDSVRYEPIVRYQGVDYRATEAVTLTAASSVRQDVRVHVFEADPNAPVRVAGISGLAQADAAHGDLAVFEVWQLANDSDRTRVGTSDAPTFHLPLPIGARDVVLEDRTTRSDVTASSTAGADGLESRLPVPPGGIEIVVSYAMPYRGTTATLRRTLPEGVDQIGWVLADHGAVAESDVLGAPVPDAFGDQPVTRYNGGPIAAGQPWTVVVRALPAADAVPGSAQDVLGPAPAPAVDQGLLAKVALALAALGIAGAIGVVLCGSGASAAGGGASRARRPARAYAATITAITALDARFERGEIARNAYQRRRAAMVARALTLRANGEGGSGPSDPPTGDAASEEG